MTLAVRFDVGGDDLVYGGELGTTKAWGNFTRWVDGLPVEGHDRLVHLAEYGWADKPDTFAAQLRAALAGKAAPTGNVRKTGEILLALAEGRPKEAIGVYVTND